MPTWCMQDNQQFADLLQNVQLVINVFNHEVDQARGEGRPEWSVSQVLSLIKGEPMWHPKTLRGLESYPREQDQEG